MSKTPAPAVAGQSDKDAAADKAGKSAPEFDAADAAKAIKATVRVQERNKKGDVEIVDRAAKAEDILSFRVEDGVVFATTIDGQKHQAEIGR